MGIVRLGQSLRIVRRDKQMNNAIPKDALVVIMLVMR